MSASGDEHGRCVGEDVKAECQRFVNMRDFSRLADDRLIDMPRRQP